MQLSRGHVVSDSALVDSIPSPSVSRTRALKDHVRLTDDATPSLRRAFDTLAKVLHPTDGSAADSLEATMQLMSGDQSGPVVELEGSLLSECHFPFKVNHSPLRS